MWDVADDLTPTQQTMEDWNDLLPYGLGGYPAYGVGSRWPDTVATNPLAAFQYGIKERETLGGNLALVPVDARGRYIPNSAQAAGPWQITPKFQDKYGPPGADRLTPEGNELIGRAGTEALFNRYGGDASRAAVAYNSPESNVTPPGAPTPWKRDYANNPAAPSGTRVSDYVAAVNNYMKSYQGMDRWANQAWQQGRQPVSAYTQDFMNRVLQSSAPTMTGFDDGL